MRFDRIRIDFDQLEEDLDGLVGLFVEQVVEAAEIVARQRAGALAATPCVLPARQVPAASGRDRKQ